MTAQGTLKTGCKIAKPIFSTNYCDSHIRVMSLYKAYFRYIPHIIRQFDIPKSERDCKMKLREYFYKNACVTDLRVIDVLVMKGFMNLKEMTHNWQQKGHVMAYWKPTYEKKPCDFIGKFLRNED